MKRPVIKIGIAILFFSLLSVGLLAARGHTTPLLTEGRLEVRVASAATGQAVRGATVGVFEAGQAATTDGKGRTRIFSLPLQIPTDTDGFRANALPPRPYGLFTVVITARGYQPLVYEMVNIYPAAKSGTMTLETRLKPLPTDPRELAAYRELRGKGYVETLVMRDHKLWLNSLVDYYEAGGEAQAAWNAESIRRGREVILDFYTLIGRGRVAPAKALLHPAMDPAYVDSALEYLASIEVRRIGEPDPNPDGRSIFFPVTLRIKVRPGAPVPWETGISTYYIRLYLVDGRPRIAEITTGP